MSTKPSCCITNDIALNKAPASVITYIDDCMLFDNWHSAIVDTNRLSSSSNQSYMGFLKKKEGSNDLIKHHLYVSSIASKHPKYNNGELELNVSRVTVGQRYYQQNSPWINSRLYKGYIAFTNVGDEEDV